VPAAANKNDCTVFAPTMQAVLARGLLADVETVHLDRGHDTAGVRDICSNFGVETVTAKIRPRNKDKSKKTKVPVTLGMGWPVERTNSWFSNFGKQKQGSAYGYTKVLGQHPLVATRAETGEVLHIRHRKGSANSGRGAPRFVRETIGRTRRAGAVAPLTLRADSGFYSKQVVAACRDHDVRYSITVSQNKAVIRATDAIIEEDWIPIDYTLGGKAEVAECPMAMSTVSSCVGPGSPGSRPSCSPRGATTPSSPIEREAPSSSMPTTATMPQSNSTSAT
jgi:hypothetical protein